MSQVSKQSGVVDSLAGTQPSAGAALVTLLIRLWLKTRRAAQVTRLASDMDQLVQSGGEIRGGLDLCSDDRGLSRESPDLSWQLAAVAVRRAAWLTESLSPKAVSPPTPLIRAVATASLVFILVCIGGVIGSRLAVTQLSRFFDPWGDHPAWSRYEFVVEPEGATLRYGEYLDIQAHVSGPDVDQLELYL